MIQDMPNQSSLGRKIEGIRKIRGVSQEALATGLGMTRQGLYKMEQSENIDDERLQQIADVLGVSIETIKNYNEDAVFNYIQNNYEGSNKEAISVCVVANNPVFNPLEKILQLCDDNKNLYEQLLKSEREKITMLRELLDKK